MAPTIEALLAAIALVSARHPIPGARLGRHAVPVPEVRAGQTPEAAAAEYLAWLLEQFDGDVRAALAAYAQGPAIRSTWVQLGRDWSALRLVLDAGTVRFVESVMVEVNRRAR